MHVYRVANVKYKEQTLSGIGAEKVGGRWNAVGTRAVYCSENASLALLEYYVHSDNQAALPKKILIAKIKIPDEFEIEKIKSLPAEWN
ncbi:MAG: RES family NAD+ phosphorylase, partial [Flavobacteriales bacterium]|nr:RES family NAD+ phosphorylase [Flavobacteriales bacterium]